ncbi:MAG: SBBP repeat-containing protein [Bacteroidia bacterium]|nr:SBBP repeat-containing protein [Bacteroidia bacterium]MDW8301557.1 SBBP repeat-containing protein [Bacteroidia bacterium]
MKRLLLLFLLCFEWLAIQKLIAKNQAADKLFFIENKGQWHNDVFYLCRLKGLDIWITKYGVNYTFYKVEQDKTFGHSYFTKKHRDEVDVSHIIGHRVIFELLNSNSNPVKQGLQQQQGYYNYFIGNDEKKHATYVGLYKEVRIQNIYEGIDIRYYFDKGSLRYDFIVHPYADPSQIAFKLYGQDKVYQKGANKLAFTTIFGEVEMAELKTYQQYKTVPSKFVKQNEIWQIDIAKYNPSETLIIDPIVYSTYIGGTDNDHSNDMFVDPSECVYVTGNSTSINYDITPGVFQTTNAGGFDVFVTKLNNTGTSLIFSTFIGGTNDDFSDGIFVDGIGSIYIAGRTLSSNYDVTSGAYQTTLSGTSDIFVTKLNATGTALIYSTFIGGSADERANGIFVNSAGELYLTGWTSSTNYDITPGAYQNTNAGGRDVVVTKLNSAGNTLIYSTYIGGSNWEEGEDISVDASGTAYITGYTYSTNYDVTALSYQNTHGGGTGDAFVSRLNATGTTLLQSTYLGGSGWDEANDLTLKGTGVYITGFTESSNFDITPGVYQTTNGGNRDVFVTQMNLLLSSLVYSTYLGGNNNEEAISIYVDAHGAAYVTGWTASHNYDVTWNAYQNTNGGNDDVFISMLSPDGVHLQYSTYLGGSNDDTGFDVFVDAAFNAYVTGRTNSTNYDITSGAYQTTLGGLNDVFVTKIGLTPLPISGISLHAAYISTEHSISLTWNSTTSNINVYQIEKLSNQQWQQIAVIPAADTNPIYTYLDKDLSSSQISYRVHAKDKDGNSYYSNIQTVLVPNFTQEFYVYPNPTSDYIYLENKSNFTQEYALLNSEGKTVRILTVLQGTNYIQLNDLPPGTYILRENKTGKSQKLIIE